MSASIKVYVSTTQGDLDSVRSIISEELRDLNFEPVALAEHPPYWRTTDKLLRTLLNDCQAIIHVAGKRYGGEPDKPTIPVGQPRRSYAQMEYDIGQQHQTAAASGGHDFHAFTLLCGENFPFDDAPGDEAQEKQALQWTHCDELADREEVIEMPRTEGGIRAAVRTLVAQIGKPVEKEVPEQVHVPVEKQMQAKKRMSSSAVTAAIVGSLIVAAGAFKLASVWLFPSSTPVVLVQGAALVQLTDQVLDEYQKRFGALQSGDLPNRWINLLVRAEMPEALKLSPEQLAAVLDTEAARLLDRPDAPMDMRLGAMFVMGRYQSIMELGAARPEGLSLRALRILGDAARAENDERPAVRLEAVELKWREKAAALVTREKEPLLWAQLQFWVLRCQASSLSFSPDAAALLSDIIAVLKAHPKVGSPAWGEVCKLAVVVYSPAEQPGRAEPFIRDTIVSLEAAYGAKDPRLGDPLVALGRLLRQNQRDDESETVLRRSLAIFDDAFGANDPRSSTCLSDLGALLSKGEKKAEGLELMRRLQAIGEANYGPTHPRVGLILMDVGASLVAMDRNDEALFIINRSVAILEGYYGPEHPKLHEPLRLLSIVLFKLNRTAEAEPVLRRVLTLSEKTFGEGQEEAARGLNDLALVLIKRRLHRQAEPLLRRVLDIYEKKYGSTYVKTGEADIQLTTCLVQSYRYADAEPSGRRGLTTLFRHLAKSGKRSELLLPGMRSYTKIAAALNLSKEKISERLEAIRSEAGLSEVTFKELVIEAEKKTS